MIRSRYHPPFSATIMSSHTPTIAPTMAEPEPRGLKARRLAILRRRKPSATYRPFETLFHPLLVKAGGVTRLVPSPSAIHTPNADIPLQDAQHLVCPVQINLAQRINKFFEAANRILPDKGLLMICCEVIHHRRQRFLNRYPAGLGHVLYAFDFVLNRVFPKLPGFKTLYFKTPLGRYRVVSETEILGRLVCCGFDLVSRREQGGLVYLAAQKSREPTYDNHPTFGPLCRLRRSGYQGKEIKVYKLRTMHPYSEYLQEYVYQTQSLHENGKFKEDFRVTSWGRFCRKVWLDEVPMLLNWIKGDLKLVGVRPLSAHYLSLYPDDLKELRKRHKPGLLPPYYADLPKSLEEIVESERRYLLAREKAPLRTDANYFFSVLANIVLRGARSA